MSLLGAIVLALIAWLIFKSLLAVILVLIIAWIILHLLVGWSGPGNRRL